MGQVVSATEIEDVFHGVNMIGVRRLQIEQAHRSILDNHHDEEDRYEDTRFYSEE